MSNFFLEKKTAFKFLLCLENSLDRVGLGTASSADRTYSSMHTKVYYKNYFGYSLNVKIHLYHWGLSI